MLPPTANRQKCENVFSIKAKQKLTTMRTMLIKTTHTEETRNVAACRHFVAFATYMHMYAHTHAHPRRHTRLHACLLTCVYGSQTQTCSKNYIFLARTFATTNCTKMHKDFLVLAHFFFAPALSFLFFS